MRGNCPGKTIYKSLWGNCPGVYFIEGNCPGGCCPGKNYLEVIVQGVIFLGRISCGAIVQEVVLQEEFPDTRN